MAEMVGNKKIIFCLIIIGVLLIDSFVLAKLLVEWPASPGVPPFGGTQLHSGSNLQDLIKYFYEWAISLGGLAVFIVLVFAGFQFLTSAGNPTQMTEAKGRMQSAAIGLILLLSSVLILNTINPELTSFRPLVLPEPDKLLGNCEFYYEIDPETGKRKEPSRRWSPEEADQYCKENFGDEYECKNNICIIDLEDLFKINHCEKVYIDTKEERVISLLNVKGGEFRQVNIESGKEFTVVASPEYCMAILTLGNQIGRGLFGTGLFASGCKKGDNITFYLNRSNVTYDQETLFEERPKLSVDINVRCIQARKIQ